MKIVTRMPRKAPHEYALKRHYHKLGAYLQYSRQLSLLTQRKVAQRLGYSSAQFISNFERGIAAPPTWRMKVLAKMYKLDKDRMLELYLEGVRSQTLEHLK